MLGLSPLQRDTLDLMGVDLWVSRGALQEAEAAYSGSSSAWSAAVVQRPDSGSTNELLILCDCEPERLSSPNAAERRLLNNILFAMGAGSLDRPDRGITLAAFSDGDAMQGESIENVLADTGNAALIVFGERLHGAVEQIQAAPARIIAPSLSRILVEPERKPVLWRQIQSWIADH